MYKFKKTTKKFEPWVSMSFPRPDAGDDPPLTGFVSGYKASDIEERFARACRNNKIEFKFKVRIPVLANLIGDKKEIDFIVMLTVPQTVDVDGEFSHKTVEQVGQDQLRDALLSNELIKYNFQVPHLRVSWVGLIDQITADRTVRNIVSGAYL